jgi:hypothetical protein
MRKYFIILIVLFSGSKTVSAQHWGFLGKKNFIEVYAVGNSPVAANFFYNYYSVFQDFSENRGPFGLFNYGLYVSAGRTLNRNLALSIESGVDFMSFKLDDGTFFDEDKYKVNCLNLMPKIEFSRSKHILPVGVSHQLGIGYLRQNFTLSGNDSEVYTDHFNGASLMYAAIVRTAITKKLLLNFGMRYTLNYFFYHYKWFDFLMQSEIQSQKRLNFISGQIGLTYLF